MVRATAAALVVIAPMALAEGPRAAPTGHAAAPASAAPSTPAAAPEGNRAKAVAKAKSLGKSGVEKAAKHAGKAEALVREKGAPLVEEAIDYVAGKVAPEPAAPPATPAHAPPAHAAPAK